MKSNFKLKELKIEVTHQCLLNCSHCSSIALKECHRNIDFSVCKSIIKDAIKLDVEKISLSGGEPLLWPSLDKIIQMLNKKNIISCVYTTGNTSNSFDIINKLKKFGLDKIIFSLLGENEESHERITKTRNSFKTTLKAIEYCVKIGLHTELHFVPLSSNYKELPNIINIAKSLGIKRLSILRFVPQGRGKKNNDMKLSTKQNIEFRNILIKHIETNGFIRLGSPYNFLLLRKSSKCSSGIDRLTITPDLNIFPCDAFKQSKPEMMGLTDDYFSLAKHSLLECWEKSTFLNTVRKVVNRSCEICLKCKNIIYCNSGCLAQKFIKNKKLVQIPDPMCICNTVL